MKLEVTNVEHLDNVVELLKKQDKESPFVGLVNNAAVSIKAPAEWETDESVFFFFLFIFFFSFLPFYIYSVTD